MVHSDRIEISTRHRCCWVDITGQVQRVVTESGITAGICSVTSLHTTAGVTINENADPDVEADFFRKLSSMVPQDSSFRHSEGNSDSHIKTSLVGPGVTVSIEKGHLVLGTWQSLYFCEFDGPRNRRCMITIFGEPKGEKKTHSDSDSTRSAGSKSSLQ